MSGERLATLRKFAASRFIFSIEDVVLFARACARVARVMGF